jgi:hypothetical protein
MNARLLGYSVVRAARTDLGCDTSWWEAVPMRRRPEQRGEGELMKTMTVNIPGISVVAFSVRCLGPNGRFQGRGLPAAHSSEMYTGDASGIGLALTSRHGSAPGS